MPGAHARGETLFSEGAAKLAARARAPCVSPGHVAVFEARPVQVGLESIQRGGWDASGARGRRCEAGKRTTSGAEGLSKDRGGWAAGGPSKGA